MVPAWDPATHPFGPGGPHVYQLQAEEREAAARDAERQRQQHDYAAVLLRAAGRWR